MKLIDGKETWGSVETSWRQAVQSSCPAVTCCRDDVIGAMWCSVGVSGVGSVCSEAKAVMMGGV